MWRPFIWNNHIFVKLTGSWVLHRIVWRNGKKLAYVNGIIPKLTKVFDSMLKSKITIPETKLC